MDFSSGYHLVLDFLHSWPTEWFILAGLTVLSIIDTIRAGSQRSTAVVLAFLSTVLLYTLLLQAAFVGPLINSLTFPIAQIVVFGMLFAFMFVAALHIIPSYSADAGKPILAICMAVATVVFLVLIWLQVPILHSIWAFSPSIRAIFSESYHFYLALGALGVFAYVRS